MAGTITVCPDVLFQDLDGEAVLLHLPTERYFSLNSVGAVVWRLWESGLTVEASIERIAGQYRTPEATVRRDVSALVAALSERGLIEISS